ncbi:FAD-dependent oxidoreductase, partial [Actinomadura kijaniata]|uniref:FAD-dependent oxidoreductase n=1 Tax=Actinomadura kijaniata TaxID=46161 RepID=UPI003F1A2E5F
MGERTALVAGGGIGGLAAALALHRRGWDVEVLERAPAFGEVGAGISLWANGVRALEALGVGQAVRDRSMPEREAGIREPGGRWLSRSDTGALERRHGSVVVLHRAHLLDLLREALPGRDAGAGPLGGRSGGRAPVEHRCE